MDSHSVVTGPLAWFAGWALALGCLWGLGIRLPLVWRQGQGVRYQLLPALAALGTVVIANFALALHDAQFDFTRAQMFSPAPEAVAVVAGLDRPVVITFFHRNDDPDGIRVVKVLRELARHSRWLSVAPVDPDEEPALAARYGVRVHNVAIVESAGRWVRVDGTDEREFALGIQRALRLRESTVCFAEGLGEDASQNPEFVTHQDAPAGHAHNDPQMRVVETTDRGYVRLRRALEAQGHRVERIPIGNGAPVPSACTVLIHAGPREPYPLATVRSLRRYLRSGGSALLLYDLEFAPGSALQALLAETGISLLPGAVSEPTSHLEHKPTLVAVTGYAPHPATREVSLSLFPGVRPLHVGAPAAGLTISPLVTSTERATREAPPGPALEARAPPYVLAAALEGTLAGGTSPMRLVVVGDADFARNGLLPRAANGTLALGMMRWLMREEKDPAVASRIPVPETILLTPAQQRAVFLLAVILLPLGPAITGAVMWWRRR